jgi:hypothetical protein
MKKILLLFAICTICSCARTDAEIKAVHKKLNSADIEEVKIKGHIYLIFNGIYKGNIIHAEHCPCKNH